MQVSAMSIILLGLWSLSPLGGQASLRLLQRGQSTNSTSMTLRYLSTGPATTVFASSLAHHSLAELRVAIGTSDEVMARQEDVYGNVKIPRYEALPPTENADGWRTVPPELKSEDYSAILGLRVDGLRRGMETRFNVESTYLTAECSPFLRLPYSLNWTRADVERIAVHMKVNMTAAAEGGLMPGEKNQTPGDMRTFFILTDDDDSIKRSVAFLGLHPSSNLDSDPAILARRRLIFGSLSPCDPSGRAHQISLTNCTLSQTHVETAVLCPGRRDGGGCHAQRVRLSRADTRPRSLTMFDNFYYASRLMLWMPRHLSGSARFSSVAETFVDGFTYKKYVVVRPEDDTPFQHVDVAKIPPARFGARLSLLLNTYHQSVLVLSDEDAASAAVRSVALLPNVTLPSRDIDLVVNASSAAAARELTRWGAFRSWYNGTLRDTVALTSRGLPFIPAATTAQAAVHTPVIVCQFAWDAVLLLAAAALFATGAAALALQLRSTLAPDMLRYVASMTYADARLGAPPGGSALDGMARARLLRDMRVRAGDVNGGGSVGEVAFVAEDEVETRELERKRLYA